MPPTSGYFDWLNRGPHSWHISMFRSHCLIKLFVVFILKRDSKLKLGGSKLALTAV